MPSTTTKSEPKFHQIPLNCKPKNAFQIQEKHKMSTIQLGVLVICETLAKIPPNSINCISEKSGQNAPKCDGEIRKPWDHWGG